MHEYQPFTVCVGDVFEDTTGIFPNTEVVPEEGHHECGCIATSGVLDALGYRIHFVSIDVDVEREKCIYSRISSEGALDPSQERLGLVDVVFILEESAERTGKILGVNLTAILFAEYVVEVEGFYGPIM